MNFNGPGWTLLGAVIGFPLGFGLVVGTLYAARALYRTRTRRDQSA